MTAEIRGEIPGSTSLGARLAGVGLSTDPVKRRRQLAGLAAGAEKRAATLRGRLAELDDEPGSSEAPARAPVSVAASLAPSEAPAASGARIVAGHMPPPPAAPSVAEEPGPDDGNGEDDDVELEIEGEERAGPSLAAKVGAALLGVRP